MRLLFTFLERKALNCDKKKGIKRWMKVRFVRNFLMVNYFFCLTFSKVLKLKKHRIWEKTWGFLSFWRILREIKKFKIFNLPGSFLVLNDALVIMDLETVTVVVDGVKATEIPIGPSLGWPEWKIKIIQNFIKIF